jgi:hypothetical protein
MRQAVSGLVLSFSYCRGRLECFSRAILKQMTV